jgi:hypothetical protein
MAGRNAVVPGIRDLSALGRGIYEANESNYDSEELELFRTNKEIKSLIENLEKSTNARKSES